MLEGLEELFLEAKVSELALLEKLHGELAQRVDGEEGHLLVGIAAGLVEVLADDVPDARPLQADAAHVVVGDLDDLLQRVHARRRGGQLVLGHVAQPLDKLDDGVAVETRRPGEYAIDGHDHALRDGLADLHLNVGERLRVERGRRRGQLIDRLIYGRH